MRFIARSRQVITRLSAGPAAGPWARRSARSSCSIARTPLSRTHSTQLATLMLSLCHPHARNARVRARACLASCVRACAHMLPLCRLPHSVHIPDGSRPLTTPCLALSSVRHRSTEPHGAARLSSHSCPLSDVPSVLHDAALLERVRRGALLELPREGAGERPAGEALLGGADLALEQPLLLQRR